jgi:hypothetical protein
LYFDGEILQRPVKLYYFERKVQQRWSHRQGDVPDNSPRVARWLSVFVAMYVDVLFLVYVSPIT